MRTRVIAPIVAVWLAALAAGSAPASAQAPPGDPPPLADLQDAAIARDPRVRELDLHAEAADLRLATIAAGRRPGLAVEGRTQYQSDVPRAPVLTPDGAPLFSPPKDTYDASLRLDVPLVEPTIEPRLAVERAARDEAQARVRTAIFDVRQEVNAAFFAAALLDQRRHVLETVLGDLEARWTEAGVRVEQGAAIPAEAASLEAALLERRQELAEVMASRAAARARLTRLTGHTFAGDEPVVAPDLAVAVERARAALDDVRARPEFAQFASTRARLARQQDVASAADRPRVSAFATAGVGRPGLNFIDDNIQGYWLTGLRVQWTAWDRGTSGRERDVLDRERAIVAAEEAAFAERLRRGVEDDLADMDRLAAAGSLDDRVVALREEVVRSARAQLAEGATTGADYANRNAELLTARLARARHRVELAQARARFLTVLGLEVR